MRKTTILLTVALSFGFDKSTHNNEFIEYREDQIDKIETTITKKNKMFKHKSFEHFLYSLAFRESSNNPAAYNRYGYLGKYQFGELALIDLGYGGRFTLKEFKKDPSVFPEWLQDKLIKEHIQKNRRSLRRYIKTYNNTLIDSIQITESGIIAAAHLVGARNTKRWLKSHGKRNIKDGNNVSIRHYLKLFAGYKIDVK